LFVTAGDRQKPAIPAFAALVAMNRLGLAWAAVRGGGEKMVKRKPTTLCQPQISLVFRG
jgi:hypothetical protein